MATAARNVAASYALPVDFNLVNQHALSLTGSYTNEWWGALSSSTRRELRRSIRKHIASGAPIRELRRELEPIFGRTRAARIAATETTRLYTEGSLASYTSAGVRAVEFVTVNDFAVDPTCEELHGRIWLLGEEIAPPIHVNCLPGDTTVSAEGVTATSKRWYEGDLVIIDTAGGKQLRATPNHPILTPHGWVSAGALHEGSDVLRALAAKSMLGGDDHEHNMPAPIEEVSNAFERSRFAIPRTVPLSAEDFHGDGVGSEVAVICTDGLLRNSGNPSSREHSLQLPLVRGDRRTIATESRASFASLRTTAKLATRSLSPPRSIVRGSHLSSPLSSVHLRPLQSLGLASSSDMNARLNQPLSDGNATDSVLLGNAILGEPSTIVRDQVSRIDVQTFAGHVYNLQTESGAYLAEGIITHNCRCFLIPVVDEDKLREALRV